MKIVFFIILKKINIILIKFNLNIINNNNSFLKLQIKLKHNFFFVKYKYQFYNKIIDYNFFFNKNETILIYVTKI